MPTRSDSPPMREAPASVGQRLLWLLHRQRGDDAALNCPVVCRLDGPLEVGRLAEAVEALVARHEALRTTLERRGRHLWQVVHEPPETRLNVVDIAGTAHPEDLVVNSVRDELRTGIDPAGFPVRATLWRLSPENHIFCLNVHHFASDGWSGAIQVRDLIALYGGETDGARALPRPAMQYLDFSAGQDEYLRSGRFRSDLQYWSGRLDGGTFDAIPLAPSSASTPHATSVARIDLDADATARLNALSRANKGTMFGLLLSLYVAATYRMTGKSDVVVASLFANRAHPGVRDTVGFMANLVGLRSVFRPSAGFQILQSSVQHELYEALMHESFPLHMLPAWTSLREGRRFDDTAFQMLPVPLSAGRMGCTQVAMVVPEAIESRFAFEVTALVQYDRLSLLAFWDRNRLGRDWVESFLAEYRTAVRAVLRDPDWRFA
jgi:Condensation domain